MLHRLSRTACPPSDRPWVDALFAELETIESGPARLLWLLGAAGLLVDRNTHRLAALVSPAALLCLAATLVFGVMAMTEYEGLAFEDDWYGPIAILFAVCLITVSVLNLKHQPSSLRP